MEPTDELNDLRRMVHDHEERFANYDTAFLVFKAALFPRSDNDAATNSS